MGRGFFYLGSFALDIGGEDERDEGSRVADFVGFSGHFGGVGSAWNCKEQLVFGGYYMN